MPFYRVFDFYFGVLTETSGKPRKCCFCCCCCCKNLDAEDENGPNRGKHLPEQRTQVETYDLTVEQHRRRSKVELNATTTAFLNFAVNNDRPSYTDRKVSLSNASEPQCYVRLDCADEVAKGFSRLSMKNRRTTLNIPEEATRL